ncbi:hypothetical protein AALP_AA2G054800 [Arabis alpina]|uniref:Uncharacterized protein n=1 Tax=Arabis alpina TaxID=50452 RepID=A0A087HFI1_ARAAL|nr:hypothetical protein AALP_AA2G054800 [Arabis alpina]
MEYNYLIIDRVRDGTRSNGELKYEISLNAFSKLFIHSLRHKTAAVKEVLLGRTRTI